MVGRAGLAGLMIIFLTGAWLITAPFALRFQPSGAHWTGAARMDVLVGAVLAVAAFVGFFVALAGRVREMYASRPE
jgi:hypothetical protein